jgi:outer membrane lipoprotein-sorting protein
MKGLKSFYIEFSANIKNLSSGTNETSAGKGWVKDKKFCASYGDNTIISNGIKTWTVVKEEKSVYESDANEDDKESINPKKLLTIWETGFKNKYEKEETLNGEAVHVIYLYPKAPAKAEYHTIILYISKSTNDMKKAILKSKDGTIMTYSLTKFSPNETIEDTKFVFDSKKYPGYTIIKD